MKAINTIPRDEYGQLLYKESKHIFKRLQWLVQEEESKYRHAIEKDDEKNELKHFFRMHALGIAAHALIKTPKEFSKL